MFPAVATKVADVKPAVTVTDAGVVSAALFVFVNATTAPPAGAAFVNVTVQPLDALDPRMLGLQLSVDTNAFAADVTVRLVDPPIAPEVAVMVALPAAAPVARPALVTVAFALLEVQVTDAVRFCVLLSL
jgi:hypothetical protein